MTNGNNGGNNSGHKGSAASKFWMALAGAVLIGAGAVWLFWELFKGSAQIFGWIAGAAVGILAFYLIFKGLKSKVDDAIEEHHEKQERKQQRAAVQDDLGAMEQSNPSTSSDSTTS